MASTKGRHSASPRVASAGAIYIGPASIGAVPHSGRGLEVLYRLGAVAPVVDLAVGCPPDGVDDAHAARSLVPRQTLLDVVDDLGLGGSRVAAGQLNHPHYLLAEERMGDADDDRVAYGLVGLEHLLD